MIKEHKGIKGILQEELIRALSEPEKKNFLSLWQTRIVSKSELILDSEYNGSPILFVESGRIQVRILLKDKNLLVRSLTEGHYCGISELALGVLHKNLFISDESSSIKFLDTSKFLAFFHGSLKSKQVWEKYCQEIQLRDGLRIHPYFRKLSKLEIVELSQLLVKETVLKGKVLIKEGSKSSSLYFIQSGRFRVTRSSWKSEFASIVEAGSVLGEMGVLEKKIRNSTVTAIQDSIVYELAAKDAETFFKKSTVFHTALKSILAERKLNRKDLIIDESLMHSSDDLAEDVIHFLPKVPFLVKKKFFTSFPIVLEESADETANACRKVILRYWGYDELSAQDDPEFPISDSDVSMSSWKEAFSHIGQTFVLDKIRYRNQLKDHIYIVRWETNRYVCVISRNKKDIKIMDPAFGIRLVSELEWDTKSGKHAVVFIPRIKPIQALFPRLSYFPGLFQFFKPTFSFLLSGILATFLIKALEISLPIINLYLIDNVLLRENREFLIPVISVVALLSVSQIGLSYLRANVLFYSHSKVNQSIITNFLEKLLSLPLTFFEKHKKGEILQRWEEIESITHFFSEQGIIKFLDWGFGLAVFLLFLFLSPILLGVIVFFLIPELLLIYSISPLIARETKKESLRSADTLSYFIETINGNETVKNLGAVSVQRWDFEKRLTSQLNSKSKRMFYTNILETSSGSFHLLTNVTVLLLGTYQIFSNNITLGTLFAIIGLIGYVRSPMISLVEDGVTYQKAKIAWKRLKDWDSLDSEYTQDSRISKVEIPDIFGSLNFTNVSYEYRSDKHGFGISGINFNLEPGSKYAFVGRSGSGKSTIVKLIVGLYERTAGEIFLDGISLDEIWTPSYRSKMGVLYQENSILLGTVRDNISLGSPDSTLSAVVEAAKLAMIHDDIVNLTLGYDTELSDRGERLSGGQKQKLAMARIFLQKPSLLVLDEPTSAMDRESEEKVLANLHRVFKDKTFIVVAHRLETIRFYDRIFVLEQGKIEESGTHRELLAGNGIYTLLHSKQEAIR